MALWTVMRLRRLLSERIVGARRWAAGLYIRAVLIATGVFAVD